MIRIAAEFRPIWLQEERISGCHGEERISGWYIRVNEPLVCKSVASLLGPGLEGLPGW